MRSRAELVERPPAAVWAQEHPIAAQLVVAIVSGVAVSVIMQIVGRRG